MRDEVGKQIPAGVAVGIEDGTGEAVEAAEQMAEDIAEAAAGMDSMVAFAQQTARKVGDVLKSELEKTNSEIEALQKKSEEKKAADGTMNVEVAKTDYREVDQVNSFTGTVEANVTNNIAPQSPMRIRKVYVEVGQHVSAGQKLADMDPANLDQVRLQMENNHLEFKRVDELFKIGGCSKSEWDAKKMAYDISRRNYENLAENTRLISPISGVVSQRNYDSGDMYSGASPIFVVEKIRPVKMKVNVSESLFTKIKKGMNVDFTLDVYGDEVFTGKVNIVYPTIDPSTRTFTVELLIANADERVRPGMYARVTINHGRAKHVVVPDRAVQKLVGSGDRYVYVVKGDKAEYRKVELGQRLDTEYEILSGVNPGETVVVAGQSRLKNGSKVKVVKK